MILIWKNKKDGELTSEYIGVVDEVQRNRLIRLLDVSDQKSIKIIADGAPRFIPRFKLHKVGNVVQFLELVELRIDEEC